MDRHLTAASCLRVSLHVALFNSVSLIFVMVTLLVHLLLHLSCLALPRGAKMYKGVW